MTYSTPHTGSSSPAAGSPRRASPSPHGAGIYYAASLRIVLAALLGLILGIALFDALLAVWLGLAVDALLRAAGGGW